MNARKARAQRQQGAPKQPGVVSRLTPAELAYYRRAGTEAEAAFGALEHARAAVQQAQMRLQAASETFTAKRGALISYADHVLGEVRKLDPGQHTVNEDGTIVRRAEAPAPPADGQVEPGDRIDVPDEKAS